MHVAWIHSDPYNCISLRFIWEHDTEAYHHLGDSVLRK